jgi:ethanolamine utilization protein EutA
VARVDESARLAAEAAGVSLAVGEPIEPAALHRIVDALAEAAVCLIRGDAPAGLAQSLMLTEPLTMAVKPQALTFSGGVSEYIYGRETRAFGDIAQLLAGRIAAACRAGRIATPVRPPREGIRATVIGAAQFTVQVSGKTIHVSEHVALPLRNVPVVAPALDLSGDIDPQQVAAAIRAALERSPAAEGEPVALSIPWRGDPLYRRLESLAEAISAAMPAANPLVLMIDGDVGRTLGQILERGLRVGRPVVSIDGIQLKEFDFVDIGAVIRPAEVVPVVIKSLLFSGASPPASRSPAPHYKPIPEARSQ